LDKHLKDNFCIIMGNEVNWVSLETLEKVDIVSYIPMKWIKHSLMYVKLQQFLCES
jgi:tRNA G18 (ribose-2'-O)-methylase SpoU